MAVEQRELCPEDQIAEALEQIANTEEGGLRVVSDLIATHPLDPRLHFLQGSVLASLRQYAEAEAAMARAIDLDREFAIARFQLGLLQLTAGRPASATTTLRPLAGLPRTHALHHFAQGLQHLMNDEFDAAIARLREGMVLNTDNVPLNRDMNLLIDQILLKTSSEPSPTDAPMSAAQLLISQSTKGTRH